MFNVSHIGNVVDFYAQFGYSTAAAAVFNWLTLILQNVKRQPNQEASSILVRFVRSLVCLVRCYCCCCCSPSTKDTKQIKRLITSAEIVFCCWYFLLAWLSLAWLYFYLRSFCCCYCCCLSCGLVLFVFIRKIFSQQNKKRNQM